ncbi:MAG: hypothetical protein JO257_12540 [Deltaproteobacteria bacterium]|nr:hypothetical protein [Deltaproteobacteria bacterium]
MSKVGFALVVLAACGGNDAGSVSGTVHGGTVSVSDSVSAAIMINTNQHGAAILMTSTGGTCKDLMNRVEHPGEKAVIITVADVNNLTLTTPTVPGTYSIYQGGQAPPKAATLQVAVDDLNCKRVDNMGAKATSGTVTIGEISGNLFSGKYDVVLDSTDHITGTFDPTECPAIQNAIDNSGSAASCLP